MIDEGANLPEIVLQTDAEAASVRVVGEPAVEFDLIVGAEVETGRMGVGVDIVGIEAVATLLDGQIHAIEQDRAHPRVADVEPVFARPWIER